MGQQRVTVRDAATYLGISESAVRNRLSRGTLSSERAEGVTYVVLEDVTDDIPPTDATTDHRDELIQVLREQLEAEREANRENRRLLAAALQMRELEAPEETRQSDGNPDEEEPQAETQGSRRSWWARLLGR